MSIAVRAAKHDDLALLASLHGICFAEKWNAQAFEALLNAPGAFALLAGTVANNWQSFALARVAANEAEVLTLGTAPDGRRKGLARGLVMAIAAEASWE